MSIDIHSSAILEGDIVFEGNHISIGPYAVLQGTVILGDNVHIGAASCIGQNAEHREKRNSEGVILASNIIIREHVIIHSGLVRPTVISNECFVMSGAYIAHDCILEDHVTLSSGVCLAGHSHIMKYANLGMNSSVHQYGVIGSYSMLGMGAVAVKNSRIEPGMTYAGVPAKFISRNSWALEKYEVQVEDLAKETERFFSLV